MRVKDFMIPKDQVATVSVSASLKEAGKLIVSKHIGSVLVVDEHAKPVGIITKTDLVRAFVEGKSADAPVNSEMETDLVYIDELTERDGVADVMSKHKVHHLLVKDNKGAFVGLTTTLDVVQEAALDAKAFPYNRSAFKKK